MPSRILGSITSLALLCCLTAAVTATGAPRRPAARPRVAAVVPAGESTAVAALERSSRHGEFVQIPRAGVSPLRAWVVYPERRDPAGVVIVIHEIFGLSDWIRAVTDQLAADGFIAVAPDMLSGRGPGGGGTESADSRDQVVQWVRDISPEDATRDLDATRAWAAALPAASGRVATIGYCWGGARSFAYAARTPTLSAAIVYYGTSPDSSELDSLRVPVLGLYGEDDARVVSTIPAAARVIARLGGSFESHLFPGAGHGFLRQQTGRDGANRRASERAWARTISFLRRHLDEDS